MLYVDRALELQGLIQAYSRTNRVFGSSKEFGTIINFQYPRITESLVNDALRLYGSGGKNSRVLVKKYYDAVIELADKFAYLKDELEDPTNWASIKHDEEKKKLFKKTFTEAAIQLGRVRQYYEFSWDDEAFGMTEHTWLQYVGAYKNLFPKEPKPPGILINNIVGKTKIQGTQIIDAQSIFTLIDKQTTSKDGILIINDNNLILILEHIQELSNLGENELAESIKTFINEELRPGHLSADTDFDTAFNSW